MLVNFSNHSSALWSDKQIKTAVSTYGNIVDIAFPMVNPLEETDSILFMAEEYAKEIADLGSNKTITVHAMGELTLTFAVVAKLQSMGYTCVASTTERKVTLLDDNRKEVFFEFVNFREYPKLPFAPNSTLTAKLN